MALPLHIPPCIHTPAHPFHPPPIDKPLRINIEGPLVSVEKLLPGLPWKLDDVRQKDYFPPEADRALAKLTYRALYGRDPDPESAGDLVIRDETIGFVEEARPLSEINYYGVTFDHLVPADDPYPEVLQININDVEGDNGADANQYLLFSVDPADYVGKKVLAVPRCCQKRKGTTDRPRVNDKVTYRETGEWPAEARMAREKEERRAARRAKREQEELEKAKLAGQPEHEQAEQAQQGQAKPSEEGPAS